ncbi:hypothetical protein PVAND_006533 [Polypedilum vanderplanki]|uniref:Peptidoglycan recognition protein n=1 Tax=Polypedilum vanderplanki TaxID=319348 RepID=A0A9J6C3H9_POLVA|nr:hypothetical protein PVAND_006533 [Polypedilum vanderplanki]
MAKSSNRSTSRKCFQGKNRKRNILITTILMAFILVVLITVPILYFAFKTESNSDDFKFENLISRDEWNAAPPKSGIPFLESPIKRIIIAHTAGEFCDKENECKLVVKRIQTENSHLDDIPYNFLIGGDGKIYEGRGFEFQGQHTSNLYGTEYNSIGICIAFMGNYQNTEPTEKQLKLLTQFINHFIPREIYEDFIILSQDSLVFNNIKSDALNEAVSKLKNFYPLQKVYRREEWGALSPSANHTKFDHDVDMVLLSHTITRTCYTMTNCAEMCRTMQLTNMINEGLIDYAFNFVIGGDGFIFEGRGWDNSGAHTINFNLKSIGITVIGNFETTEPTQGMLDSLYKLMEDGAVLGKLTTDFQVYGRQDFNNIGPGEAFMKHIREWCRYGNRTEPCNPNMETTARITTEVLSSTTQTIPEFIEVEFLKNRHDWNANPPKSGISRLSLPIQRIIVAHTDGNSCDNEEDCKALVKRIQTENSHLDDIPYNFLIGNDGKIYEGRGFAFEGEHTSNLYGTEYNSIGICITFMGNYQSISPSEDQLKLFENFIDFYILNEIISENYIIVIQDDLMYKTIRANALNEAVSKMEHFYPLQKVYRREEWNASSPNGEFTKFSNHIDLVLLSHSVTRSCNSSSSCAALCRSMQKTNIETNGWVDFGFNFAIGGDGFIFEARGFDNVGAHMKNFNSKSIGIVAIGDFNEDEPNQKMLDTLEKFLEDAAKLGKLSEDFKVHGRQDFGSSGPGENIMKHIREWCRYGNRTEICDISSTTLIQETSTITLESTTTLLLTTPKPLPKLDFLISREEWNANPPNSGISRLSFPAKVIIIAQTLGKNCFDKNECIELVKEIQVQNSDLDDIPYNFLIGNDGKIYEGRGFEFQGQHTSNLYGTEFNSIGICVAFMGNYQTISPSENQMKLFENFIDFYILNEIISENYIIVIQDDLMYKTIRANALNEAVSGMEHFYPLQKVYRREEWNASSPNGEFSMFSHHIDLVLLSHSVTRSCNSSSSCAALCRSMQKTNIETNGWVDFGFNFAIGGDGFIFEARGFDNVGAHMANFNSKSIGIVAIGDFNEDEPTHEMLDTLENFLEDAAKLGKLSEDFKIHGRQDFGSSGPGENIMKHIREWCRYGNRTSTC